VRERQARHRIYLQIIKQARGCADCGLTLIPSRQLHFHHLEPRGAIRPPSKMVNASLERLNAELEKCVVLCDHCHGRRHYESIAA
jgi:hypothetical protein